MKWVHLAPISDRQKPSDKSGPLAGAARLRQLGACSMPLAETGNTATAGKFRMRTKFWSVILSRSS